jgi:hypothetical protein
MKTKTISLSSLLGLLVLAGCASTEVTERQRVNYEMMPRPQHIWVYDFGSTPADIPQDSAFSSLSGSYHPPTEEQAAVGRQLGTQIAAKLVDDIREMGLPAERAVYGTSMAVNDIVIRGYLTSIDKGSAAARMTIGFGAGGSELTTSVEGFQVVPNGMKRLGSATLNAKSGKTPGAGLGAAGWAITGSPVGLIVSGGMKIYGEASGSATVEGRADKTAKEIAEQLKIRFQEQGWIAH